MTGKKHISRLAAPKTWPIERKKTKWIAKSSPGPHRLKDSLPMVVLLRDILKIANNKKETKYLLNNKYILVNNIPRKDYNFPVGLFDILQIPKLDENYIILFNTKGKLFIKKIKKEDSKFKISKIIGKKTLKKNKTQINLFDGNNILLEKNNYKVGDSLVIDLDTKKIKQHLPLEKGSVIYLIGGAKIGNIGKVKEIVIKKDLQKPKIIYEINKEEHKTLKEYAFVIGKEKAIINIKE